MENKVVAAAAQMIQNEIGEMQETIDRLNYHIALLNEEMDYLVSNLNKEFFYLGKGDRKRKYKFMTVED